MISRLRCLAIFSNEFSYTVFAEYVEKSDEFITSCRDKQDICATGCSRWRAPNFWEPKTSSHCQL